MKIGFIGLGIMGAPMVGRLLDGGHQVFANDLKPIRPEILEKGATEVSSAKEATEMGDVIIGNGSRHSGWRSPTPPLHRNSSTVSPVRETPIWTTLPWSLPLRNWPNIKFADSDTVDLPLDGGNFVQNLILGSSLSRWQVLFAIQAILIAL